MTTKKKKEILRELDNSIVFWETLSALIDKANEWDEFFIKNFEPNATPRKDVCVTVCMAMQNEIKNIDKLMEM